MKNVISALILAVLPFVAIGQNLAPVSIPLADVEQVVLPKLDNKLLYEEELARREPGVAPRFAEVLEVNINPSSHGLWEILPDRTAVWRLRLYSATAKSLNLGFTSFFMPEGGELLLYNPKDMLIQGPFTPADNEEHEQLWTPIIPGDQLVLEVQIPQARMHELQLQLKYVNHDFIGFGDALVSGSCNLDVICGEDDGWDIVDEYRDIIQSVAAISTGGSAFCTGFLINNEREDCTPYFMTAWHCGINNGNAPSLVAYWNFQNSTCREPGSGASGGPGDGVLSDFNSGSTFRAGWSDSDFVLVELDDPVSETAEGFFAGWTISDEMPTDTIITVHHPSSDEKRISFEFDDTYLGTWDGGSAPDPNGDHIIVPDWDIGTTEGGSSGGPLFDKNKRVVGQLHGGLAACSNNLYDSYGWFTSSWTGGGTSSTRLSDWLDPDGTGIIELDGRSVAQCGFNVDATPPSVTICGSEDIVYMLEVSEAFVGDVTLSILGLPVTVDIDFSVNPVSPGGTSVLTLSNIGSLGSGQYSFTLEGTDGSESTSTALSFNVFETVPGNATLQFPFNGSVDVDGQPTFMWASIASVSTYEIELALDDQFIDIVGTAQDLVDPSYNNFILEGETTYYWRVRGANPCGDGDWSDTFSFTTAVIDCLAPTSTDVPVIIPGNGYPTVTSTLEFPNSGTISDVDVIGVNGVHTWVGDLTITITSPEGTTVVLVDQICDYDENFSFSFDDDAASSNIPCPPTTGLTYQPAGSLAAFNNEDPQGPWILTISDNADYDGGQLDGWGLSICTAPVNPGISVSPFSQQTCDDETAVYTVEVNAGFTGPVALTGSGQPTGGNVTFSPNPATPGSNVTATVTNPNEEEGSFTININADDGATSLNFSVNLDVDLTPDPAVLQMPDDEAEDVVLQPTLIWDAVPNAVEYQIELASDPDFNDLLVSSITTNTSLALSFELDGDTEYFWRVLTIGDPCDNAASETFSFTTEEGSGVNTLNGQAVHIQPNPTNGPLQITFNQAIQEDIQLMLWTVDGRLLQNHKLQIGTVAYELDMNTYSDGVYILQLKSAGQMMTERLILQE